jgi:hypothetical protein
MLSRNPAISSRYCTDLAKAKNNDLERSSILFGELAAGQERQNVLRDNICLSVIFPRLLLLRPIVDISSCEYTGVRWKLERPEDLHIPESIEGICP